MNGLVYRTELDAEVEDPSGFDRPETPGEYPVYGGPDSYLKKGERIWMYALPDQGRLQVRLNGVGSWYEPSTESMVCQYLKDDGVFDPDDAPGEEPGRLESLRDRALNEFTGLAAEDRELLEQGAALAADPETYYQEIGELCYRNR